MPRNQMKELSQFAKFADKEARSDLIRGFITGENDYTSNFTGALRRIINSHSRYGLEAISYVLPNTIEQTTGCDAAIVVRSGNQDKVAIFEAKLPRLVKPNGWDYAQKSTGNSHFGDQLHRQIPFTSKFAVFEMIYCEAAFGQQVPEMHDYLSSCAWHRDAMVQESKRIGPIWTYADLRSLFATSRIDICKVIEAVCSCKEGTPLSQFAEIENEQFVEIMSKEYRISGDILVVSAGSEKFRF